MGKSKNPAKIKPIHKTIEIHSSSADEWALSDKRAPVFTLLVSQPAEPDDEGKSSGETVEVPTVYTMPAEPNGGLALAYLKQARRGGGDLAMSWLIETAVGEEAYDELASQPSLTPETIQQIVQRIQTIAMGGLDGPKG